MNNKKVAVVTGAANGIGSATAQMLVKDGYEVIGLDREPGKTDQVTFYKVDITQIDRHNLILDEIESRHGPISAFVNAAGAYAYTTVADITHAEFYKQLSVFLDGAVFLSRSVGLRMVKRGGGRIVNVSSTASFSAMPNSLAYNTAKGGLDAATRSLALEFAAHNVLINIVAPGFVRTRMSTDPVTGINEADVNSFRPLFVESGRLPIGRTAEPEEIAGPIVFLLSERNTYISGETLVVDGGLTSTM